MGDYSAAQLMAGISAALKAGDIAAVVDLLHVLTVESPRDAALIVDAIEALR